jgi:hypothetical protein
VKKIIYPATRAVEHASTLPGVVPLRHFPVLLPLWRVDTSAEVYDHQQFEVIDHFIVRAVHEGGIRDRTELIAFLNLPEALVDRCLSFLRRIGHVTTPGPALELTDLGRASVRDGVRYLSTTHRQNILVEKQTGWPLPRAYYDAGVAVLDRPEINPGQLSDRTTFLRVFTHAVFEPKVLSWLASNPDPAAFGLPAQLRDLRHGEVREGFLPFYLIETTDSRVLAYSAVGEQRDEFLERVCAATSVPLLIQAECGREPAEVWREWHAQTTAYGSGTLKEMPTGQWHVVLPSEAFGEAPKVPLIRLGTHHFREHHFLKVWCDDPDIRQVALHRRLLRIATQPDVTTEAELLLRMRNLAGTLQVPEITMTELREQAQREGIDRRLDRLGSLANLH